MHKLIINRNIISSLFEHTYVVYPVYQVTSRSAKLTCNRKMFPKPEVLEWLIENIGEYRYAFRKFDRPYAAKESIYSEDRPMNEWDGITIEEWNRINPIIPSDRRSWTIGDDYITFATTEQAVLFKLRWF